MNSKRFSLKERVSSFKYAFGGLRILIRNEHNAWIHSIAAVGVTIAGIFFQLAVIEWVFIVVAIGLVFMAELFNTAIEQLGDAITTENHLSIKKAKDLSAAAVFIAAITAVVVGIIIFLPKVIVLFQL